MATMRMERGLEPGASPVALTMTALEEACLAVRAATELPLLIQPDAGLPESRDGRLVHGESPEDLSSVACDLVLIGARILGGCCGTPPAHVRAMCEPIRKA